MAVLVGTFLACNTLHHNYLCMTASHQLLILLQDNDEIWECTEDYMAEILHPYILTSPNPTPQLVSMGL